MIIGLPVTTVVAHVAQTPAPTVASTAAPAASPSVTDAAVTARAKDWLHQIQAGKIDRSQLTPKMNAAITDATLSQVSAQLVALGDPTAFALTQKTTRDTFAIYVFKVDFSGGITLYETFALDPGGKIAGLYIGKQ